MKKLVFVLSIFLSLQAFSQSTFIRTIGDNGHYRGIKSLEDTAGNIYVLANRTGFTGVSNIIVYKFNRHGTLLREMVHFSKQNDVAKSFRLDSNGFIICGNTLTPSNDYQILLLKMDSLGATIWRDESGGNDWDFANDVEIIDTSHYLVSGTTYSYIAGKSVCFTAVYSGAGDSLSGNYFSFQGESSLNAISKESDSLFLVVGLLEESGGKDCFLMMINKAGDSISKVHIDTSLYMECYKASRLINGNIAIAGYIEESGSKSAVFLLVDSFGNYSIAETHGGSLDDVFYDFAEISIDSLIFTGSSASFNQGDKLGYGVVVNESGVWRNSFISGGKYDDEFNSVILTSDGGILFTGYTESYGSSQSSVYIVKTLKDLSVDTSNYFHITARHSHIPPNTGVRIFPNPAGDNLYFEGAFDKSVIKSIIIRDVIGRQVYKNDQINSNSINVSSLPQGYYFIFFQTENLRVSSAFVIKRS